MSEEKQYVSIFEELEDLISALELDACTKGTPEWAEFKERYDKNVEYLKTLVELL